MKFLVLQETDWLNRGPHIQHHLMERISVNHNITVTVFDYDIDHKEPFTSRFETRKRYTNIQKTINKPNKITIFRSAYLRIPFLQRLSSMGTLFFSILQEIRSEKPVMIINYSLTNGLIGWFFAKLFHIPFVFHYIDILHELIPIAYARRFAHVISRFLLLHSDHVIVLNDIHRRYIMNEGVDSSIITVIKTGISLKNTTINQGKLTQLRKQFNIKSSDFVIFFMGYLYDFAGLIEIIKFYNQDVQSKALPLKFVMLGDGGIYNDLRKLKEDLHADWVILAGRVPYFEIAEYIELADLCLLSFKINKITREISPIKIFEYMAQKKPALSTKLPGIYIDIKDNNGVYFTDTQEELIQKIRELSVKKEELRRVGEIGYKFVKDNFDWDIIINEFKELLIKIVKNYHSG
jgi:glycosyltransferase involved in cell wall biosynthesis